MDKSKICIVRAKPKESYVYDGLTKMGYQVYIPYKDINIVLRCMREVWFRLKLPGKQIWMNRKIAKSTADVFFVNDGFMCPEFFTWMRKHHPDARIILDYTNRVSSSIDPNTVDANVEKWTYDPEDCEKYSMKLKTPAYLDVYRLKELEEPEYDILYLGRDKGRAEYLLGLQKQMEDMGLKTCFRICADHRYNLWAKSFYQPNIPYVDYLKLVAKSRAILNIMPDSQRAVTQRDMEAVYDNLKCITNNQAIVDFAFYDPDRFFILGRDDLSALPDFLRRPCQKVPEEKLRYLSYDNNIEYILSH